MKQFVLIENEDYSRIIKYLKEIKNTKSIELDRKWITEAQLKEYLGCGTTWLWELRNNYDLPYTVIKGKRYYKLEDIEKLLEQNYKGNGKEI